VEFSLKKFFYIEIIIEIIPFEINKFLRK